MVWLILIIIIFLLLNVVFDLASGGKSNSSGNEKGGLNSFEKFDMFSKFNKK